MVFFNLVTLITIFLYGFMGVIVLYSNLFDNVFKHVFCIPNKLATFLYKGVVKDIVYTSTFVYK